MRSRPELSSTAVVPYAINRSPAIWAMKPTTRSLLAWPRSAKGASDNCPMNDEKKPIATMRPRNDSEIPYSSR